MIHRRSGDNSIPVSISLQPTLEAEHIVQKPASDKRRIVIISLVAIAIAMGISLISKALLYLINLATNVSFYGQLSITPASPADNTLGAWVILVPVVGGLIVGLMALYGSKAIRGHGIPEAMEQILTNDSKIKPAITFLKPISSAIAIGTGGPFGAEGPIIATGGALGSTIGQVLKITHNERKILLAAGATAGMSAIFGSPVAAIFLAIELLLFEFSPGSLIPVALACVTGAAGHYMLFDSGYVFPSSTLSMPGNRALLAYGVIGLGIGLLAVGITKLVYAIEDTFEKLPIHWMWWPAIGGLVVGIVGYYAPRTLGVGYDNISDMLSGHLSLTVLLSLCLLKFVSWSIALASGTSGGTLAPLLTIGGAAGALVGSVIIHLFPDSGVSIPMSALIGMAAMFAGASRAFITSIIFAIETTGQSHALPALLVACTGAYLISFLLMKNTIMTEKIARRGVKTPHSYRPDILEEVTAREVMNEAGIILSEENNVAQVREWLATEPECPGYYAVADSDNRFLGIIRTADFFKHHPDVTMPVTELISGNAASIGMNDTLKAAVELMIATDADVLPVISGNRHLTGMVTYASILSAYRINQAKHRGYSSDISVKRRGLKMLVRGKKLVNYR